MDRFKIFKNDENIYRVQLLQVFPEPRWLTDLDLMVACVSSHRTRILNFTTKAEAEAAIKRYLDKEEMMRILNKPKIVPIEPIISETFKEED